MDHVNESFWRCSTLIKKIALKKRTKSGVSVYYDRLKLQVLCVLLSLVLTEEKEAAHR